ncbi:MAG: trigger factor, partial [Candidatus Symbiothrix sp.]|nr:trigger factor [Candidatus Symbiothrix sp.]
QVVPDFDKQEDFEFTFDLGLAPEITAQLTKEDKIPYYTISVSDELAEKQIQITKKDFSTPEIAGDIQENDVVKGILTELNEDGSSGEDGLCSDEAVLMPSFMKDEEEKTKFFGAKSGDILTFNPVKAYEGNEVELASFLKIKKEEIADHTGNFTFEITEITRLKEPELNQELFDKIFEPGTVTSEEQFKEKIREKIARNYRPQSDYKFILDIRKVWEDKLKELIFPDTFLKRWLTVSNPGWTEETVEKDYPKIIADLKFQFLRKNIMLKNNIEITEEDIREAAVQVANEQFLHYGMDNVPDYLLEQYAQGMLKKSEMRQNMANKAEEQKLVAALKETVTLENKEITVEEFVKLIKQN